MVTFQHSPMNIRSLENIECGQKMMVVFTGKWFGEKVGNIVSGRDLFENDRLGLDQFSKVMVTNVNMFHLTIILHSLHESECPSTITLYYPQHSMPNLHLIQPRFHPDHLLCTSRHCDILSLNHRERNHHLSLATPSNCSPGHC